MSQPNVVYVMADQLRRQSCGYAGDGLAKTPNIDRLADESMSFDNAVTSMPVCSAYRASLFTGKYTTSTGMVINEVRLNPDHHPHCLAHCLADANYELGYIGIFPDGLPMGNGWQSSVTSFNDVDSHNSDGPDGPTCTIDSYDYDVYNNCRPEESTDACNWGTSCADDEGFIRSLLQTSFAEWSGDANQVLLTGFSQGGQSAQSLSWRLSDVVTVTAPHHGFAANGYTQSSPSTMSLFQVWATGDSVVNGAEVPSSDGMIYDGADETAAVWALGQSCDSAKTPYPTPFDGTQGWTCVEHANCQMGAMVVNCVWQGGHTWGRVQGTNFALESMLTFFAAQAP